MVLEYEGIDTEGERLIADLLEQLAKTDALEAAARLHVWVAEMDAWSSDASLSVGLRNLGDQLRELAAEITWEGLGHHRDAFLAEQSRLQMMRVQCLTLEAALGEGHRAAKELLGAIDTERVGFVIGALQGWLHQRREASDS